MPLVFGALLWVANILSESNRIPYEIANSASKTAVMFCTEGKIVRETPAWYDRLVDAGSFRCTAWRSRGGETDQATGAVALADVAAALTTRESACAPRHLRTAPFERRCATSTHSAPHSARQPIGRRCAARVRVAGGRHDDVEGAQRTSA